MVATVARPVYFQRQNVSAEDLNVLFSHDAAEWRQHNLSQHGCGVVCGLAVHWGEVGKTVRVTPGYAVGPQGDEILVPEEQTIAVDCTGLDCDECLDPSQQCSENAVYIAIRYTTEPSCQRPISPERCAAKEDCLPVRICDSFEIGCRSEKPQNCEPRMNFEGCSSHALLLGLLQDHGEAALSRLFACPPDTQVEWLVLATITSRPDPRGRLVPELSYTDRAYLPSTRYLLGLLRILGAQTLKKQAVRAAITSIGGVTSGVLTFNRGRILDGLLVTGREFSGAQAVLFEPPATPDGSAQIVSGSISDNLLRIDLHIPVDTPIRRLSLVIELENGLRISSGAQQLPIFIDLIDNSVRGIPAIQTIDSRYRQLLIDRLESHGMKTAQSVVIAGVFRVMQVFAPGIIFGFDIPDWRLAFQFAQLIVQSARQWLADGAP
jgi:hypothetical protein